MFLRFKICSIMNLKIQTSPKRIFLADDDADDRSLFAEALHKIDSLAILTQAEDGKALMDKLYISVNPLPDVIILDINMPKLNGFDCLEKIRGDKGNLKNTPVIILSTCNCTATIEKAKKLGANFYAIKPNSFSGLNTLINEIIQIDWSTNRKRKKNKFRLS